MKMMLNVRCLLERIALWILNKIGTKIFVVPMFMQKYNDEITELCLQEEKVAYDAPDIHGDGYFKTRRVLVAMLKAHPELRNHKRALLKAIIVCSDLISFGQ